MNLSKEIKNQILEALEPLDLEEVILFGSYAYGTPDKYSDIDLYIVTKDNFLPTSFQEKNNIYLKYASRLYELEKKVSIDLIVHTKPMKQKFIELNSSFCKKLLRDGVKII